MIVNVGQATETNTAQAVDLWVPPTATEMFYDSDATGNYELYAAALDATSSKQVTRELAYNSFWAKPNPTNPNLVMFCRSDAADSPHDDPVNIQTIHLLDTDNGVVTTLINVSTYGWTWIAHPEWDNDGDSIVAMFLNGDQTALGIVTFSFNAGTKTATLGFLQATISNTGANTLRDPSFSHNGTKIVYVRVEDGSPSTSGVYRIDRASSTTVGRGLNWVLLHSHASHNGLFDPYVSPNSTKIVVLQFVDIGPPMEWSLAVFDAADGANWAYIINDGHINSKASWATNNRVLFHRLRNGTDTAFDLWAVDLDGTDLTQLTSTSGPNEAYPHVTSPLNEVVVGQASETDAAQSVSWSKVASVGQAQETDAAQAVSVHKIVSVGQASETDVAQAASVHKVASVGQAQEADVAQAVSWSKVVTLDVATETSTSQSLVWSKTLTVGLAVELDSALVVVRPKIINVAQAVELNEAPSVIWIGPDIILAVGPLALDSHVEPPQVGNVLMRTSKIQSDARLDPPFLDALIGTLTKR